MFSLVNKKYLIIGTSSLIIISGSFIAGRSSAKKATEIQFKDRIVYVKDDKKTDNKNISNHTNKNKRNSGHVVIVEHRDKDGDYTKTKTIDYNSKEKDRNSFKEKEKKTDDVHIAKEETKEESIKKTSGNSSDSIEYGFMVGRSFNNSQIKYLPEVGIPIFFGIKGHVGMEFPDKTIFAGVSINY